MLAPAFFIVFLLRNGFAVENVPIIDHHVGDNCSLAPELKAEIRAYQPVVNKIIEAAVNGSFAGNTYKR